MTGKGNVLFITVDQMALQVLSGPLAAHVATPNIDRLARGAANFGNHFTVTVPCGPARASLLTGLYAMNHRAIRNGTPLARHHATLGTEARKAGYEPLLFGYSDITPDPTQLDPEDPDLLSYEGVAPGFRELVEMRLDDGLEWPAYLRAKGYDFVMDGAKVPDVFRPRGPGNAPRPSDPALYSAEDSDTAYLADRTLQALDIRRQKPWFAHVTFIRPHPPLVAPAPYNRMVDPAGLPVPNFTKPDHPFLDAWFSAPASTGLFWGFDGDCAALPDTVIGELRAVYLGLMAEVDHHIGRLLDWLDATGQTERTLVVLTADHGEMLGEKRMWGKESVFDPAFRIPLIIRDPRACKAAHLTAMTESVDIAPTILDWIGRSAPEAMDGRSLLPLVHGGHPADWRDAVFLEADFGDPATPTRFQRHLGLTSNQTGVSILREERWKYVHFGGGLPPLLFDLSADPMETLDRAGDPACATELTRLARRLIDRMSERRDRRLTHFQFG
ncbi:MAG: alkaline phosphatase family protein [Rhodobacteraceae bacterium]|nr:alkaline phosphatase family protein [Paracoccaceae bacterium]